MRSKFAAQAARAARCQLKFFRAQSKSEVNSRDACIIIVVWKQMRVAVAVDIF